MCATSLGFRMSTTACWKYEKCFGWRLLFWTTRLSMTWCATRDMSESPGRFHPLVIWKTLVLNVLARRWSCLSDRGWQGLYNIPVVYEDGLTGWSERVLMALYRSRFSLKLSFNSIFYCEFLCLSWSHRIWCTVSSCFFISFFDCYVKTIITGSRRWGLSPCRLFQLESTKRCVLILWTCTDELYPTVLLLD